MTPRLRRGAIAVCFAAALALAGGSARAIEAGPDTKNFNVPAGVPDHFSNEREPFAASPAAQGPMPHSTVSRGPRSRHVAARRGRGGHGHVVHARFAHGHVASHSQHRGHGSVHPSSGARHTASHARTAARPHSTSSGRHG